MLSTKLAQLSKFREKVLLLFAINYFIHFIVCHVSLTFPEARFPPFDFLDSFRTTGNCGVPKSSRSIKLFKYKNLTNL